MSDLTGRLIRWLVRKTGVETLFYLGTLVLILWTVLNSLDRIVRGFDPASMAVTGLAALLSGWLLGRSRLRAGLALPGGLLAGCGWVFWQVGHLSAPAWNALQAANHYFLSWLAWQTGTPVPSGADLATNAGAFWRGLAVMAGRGTDWASSALGGQPVFDPVAAALVWGLAIWLVSAWSGWAVRRWRKPLVAVAPGAGLVGLSLAAASGPTFSFLILLASTLAMLGWNSFSQEEGRWVQLAIDYSDDLRLDTIVILIAMIMTLTSVAAVSPSVSFQKLADWADRFSSSFGPRTRPSGSISSGGKPAGPASTYEPGLTFGESLGLPAQAEPPKPSALDVLRASGGLPQEHLLGSGPELSEQIVMAVRDENPPDNPAGVRYYWRAVTYDRYSGVGWASAPTQASDYSADQRALTGGMSGQVMIRQDIQALEGVFGGGSILFAPGELLAASQDYQIAWRRAPDDALEIGDPFGTLARAPIQPPYSYRIEALVSRAGQEQLRQAGSRYPNWMLENDLLLPDSLPGRVAALAAELTATQPTPYDRALAIEAYLRTYPYTLDLDEPPNDRDLVDYFLFDLKMGYCDYYASAMVVLARAAGIPGRLAVGYVGGSYDPENNRYLVSAAEAHSWPELFFPTYGWIGFEPTAGRPPLEHSEQATSLAPPEWQSQRANFFWRVDWLRLGGWLLAACGLILLGFILRFATESWWIGQQPPRQAVAQLYRRLYQSGKKLQVVSYPGDTPGEFGRSLAERLAEWTPNQGDDSQAGQTQTSIMGIISAYSQLIYSPQAPEAALKRQALGDWQLLRKRLWRARLQQWVGKIRQAFRLT